MAAQIVHGPLAKVYTGKNAVCDYLVEGDDLQERADAICDKFWLAAGRRAEIRERNLSLFGVRFSDNGPIYEVFTSLEAAERYVRQCV